MNSDGFTALESVLVVGIFVIIGLASWQAYHNARKHTVSSTTPVSSTPLPSVNPYAGWLTGSLTYEKATFKYPTTWKLTTKSTPHDSDNDAVRGSDAVTLTSADGLTLTINTGNNGQGDGFNTPLLTEPIRTLGQTYNLDYAATGCCEAPSTTKIDGAYVSRSTTADDTYIPSKNLSLSDSNTTPDTVISVFYPDSSDGFATDTPLVTFQKDPAFATAKLIIESLTY